MSVFDRSTLAHFGPKPAPWIIGLTTLATGTAVVASMPWRRAFTGLPVTRWVVIAAMASSALAALHSVVVRRWITSVASVVLGLVLLAVVGGDGSPSAGLVLRGLTRAPARLVSDTLPLAGPAWTMVVPVGLTYVTAAVATRALLNGRVGLAATTWILSFVVADGATMGAPGSTVTLAVLLAAAVAVAALTSRWMEDAVRRSVDPDDQAEVRFRRAARVRTGVLGASLAVVMIALSATLVPRAATFDAEPRAPHRTPPIRAVQSISPVATTAELRDERPRGTPTTRFTVTTTRSSNGYLRVASPDIYDGQAWTSSRTYRPTGGRIPQPLDGVIAAMPTDTTEVVVRRAIPGQPAALPHLSGPALVTGIPVVYDQLTGEILAARDLRDGDTAVIRSSGSNATVARLDPDTPIIASTNANDTAPPLSVATDLADLQRRLETAMDATATPTVGFLQELRTYLGKADRRLASKADLRGNEATRATSAGLSFAEVVDAVLGKRKASPEQFATFTVLVARQLGVPAHVVTGFRVSGSERGPVAPGRHALTDADAWTWAEIPVQGQGWVVLDVTPNRVGEVDDDVTAGVGTTTTTQPPPQANALPRSSAGGNALAPRVKPSIPTSPSVASVWLTRFGRALAVLLSAALAVPIGAWLLRRGRRVLRRRGDPAKRVIGAWHEVLDRLTEAGLAGLGQRTAPQVRVESGQFGEGAAMAVGQVGALADRAAFQRRVPIDDAEVAEAWAGEAALRREVDRALGRRERLRRRCRASVRRW